MATNSTLLINSLSQLTKDLYYAECIHSMLSALYKEINKVLGFNFIWLYEFVDNDKEQIKLIAVNGKQQEHIRTEYPVIDTRQDKMIANILSSDKAVYIEDARTDVTTNKQIVEACGNRTIINCQLFLGGESIGTFGTGSFGDEGIRKMSEEEITYFESITNIFSIALERINYRNLSLIDPLTGIENKRSLKLNANVLLSLAERNHQKLAVVFIDLDNFKPANDKHGHHFGDEVLKSFVNGLNNTLRQSDIKVRYGGDEFVLILPNINDEFCVQKVLEEININCTDYRNEHLHYQIHFSAGYAIYPEDGKSINKLIETADKRMYKVKAQNLTQPVEINI